MIRHRIAGLCRRQAASLTTTTSTAAPGRSVGLQQQPLVAISDIHFPRIYRCPWPQQRFASTTTRTTATTATSPSTTASSGPYSPLRPPSPASLGTPRKARDFRRTRKWLRRLLYASIIFGGIYVVDRQVYASGIARSARTLSLASLVALDYKINFRVEPLPIIGSKTGISGLHRRNAERLFDLLIHNGGLYLKIGQAIAMQSAVLPPEFQKMFAKMFDDAPQREWAGVEKLLREEFGGRSVEEVFGVSFSGEEGKGVMERTARASASVAQVHWARLADGREVALKIQKPEIAKQIGWDLWSFKVVTKALSWWHDVPFYSMVPFISERLRLETDFLNEAKNSENMRTCIENEPSLKGRVYIPHVYRELSSRRVLTTEWIEGVRLWDKDTMTAPWLGGRGNGSPGVDGQTLPAPSLDQIREKVRHHPDSNDLKPDRDAWKGPRGKGGLGVKPKEVMTTMIDLFSAQIFLWGTVHCDPHPGNIFIRRLPSGRAELVLIDHGLYVYMTPQFRREYSQFWKSLMIFDNKTMTRIAEGWGIKGADVFASATLLRPYEGGDSSFKNGVLGELEGKTPAERQFEMQQRMKHGIKDMLADEKKWPRELIFIGRNMRIVQGNNQYMGSPVNRIKMMGEWASKGLFLDENIPWQDRLKDRWRHVLFKGVLFGSDVVFYFYRMRQWFGVGKGMEDEVEARMARMAKDFGIELQHDVFEG